MSLTQIFSARVAILSKARTALEAQGIRCRISRPRHGDGVLKVDLADAERARRFLRQNFEGRVISAAEAAWFVCHACGAALSDGQWRCPECQAIVGDPHGR